MFELMRARESAKNERNKFLRYFLMKYTEIRLRSIFFNRFDIKSPDLVINKEFFDEFFQFYNCTKDGTASNFNYAQIIDINIERQMMIVRYKNHRFYITMNSDECTIVIKQYHFEEDTLSTTIIVDYNIFKSNIPGTIILMAIYNYCVSYIYGVKSNLYKDEEFTKLLCDMYF